MVIKEVVFSFLVGKLVFFLLRILVLPLLVIEVALKSTYKNRTWLFFTSRSYMVLILHEGDANHSRKLLTKLG